MIACGRGIARSVNLMRPWLLVPKTVPRGKFGPAFGGGRSIEDTVSI